VIGSYSALRVPEAVLRVTLAAVLILVAGKIGYQEWQLQSRATLHSHQSPAAATVIAIPARDVIPGATQRTGTAQH
jgi:uncharacterized membrane protein YfcA